MEKTTVYLTVEQQAQLDSLSKRMGRPKAELIREAVAAYVSDQPRPRPRTRAIVSSGLVHSDQVEEWLEHNWVRDW